METTQDQSLDAIRERLAPEIAAAAVFDGWSSAAVRQAAEITGVDTDVAAYAFKDGAMAMIAAWIGHIDNAMIAAHPHAILSTFPIRERIRRLVQFRLDAQTGREEALSRALATMALPRNAASALKLAWRSADQMWRLAGDTATDYNHYTKRAILTGIYGATLSVFADDESEDKAETRALLDRRIEGIMRFEKAKASLLRKPEDRFSMSRFLGRLRYPAS